VLEAGGISLAGLLRDLRTVFSCGSPVHSQSTYADDPRTGYLTVTFQDPHIVQMLEDGKLPFLQAALHHQYLMTVRGMTEQPFADPELFSRDGVFPDLLSNYGCLYFPRGIGMGKHGDHPLIDDDRLVNNQLRSIQSLDFSAIPNVPATFYELLGSGYEMGTIVKQGDVMGVACGSQVKGVSIAQHGGRATPPSAQDQVTAGANPPAKVSIMMDLRPVTWGRLSDAARQEKTRFFRALCLNPGQSLPPLPPDDMVPRLARDVWRDVELHPWLYPQLLLQNLHNTEIVAPSPHSDRNKRNGETREQ
jgi:hypothetical protein